MTQGTTPTHFFSIPFEKETIREVWVTYAQDGKAILTKKTSDCTIENQEIIVSLTQEDTFLFDHEKDVQIQIRVLTITGQALASQTFYVDVGRCLNPEVIA